MRLAVDSAKSDIRQPRECLSRLSRRQTSFGDGGVGTSKSQAIRLGDSHKPGTTLRRQIKTDLAIHATHWFACAFQPFRTSLEQNNCILDDCLPESRPGSEIG